MKRLLLIMGFLFVASHAFAAPGACPGGNVTTDANGNPATLASLGVTTGCYFISAAGSDSNNGTTEATAWLHAPHMPNCSATCATVQNATLPAGVGLIFRGGDTWHFGSGTAPAVGGTWEFNSNPFPNGTSIHPIYIGVDTAWFTGASWHRPIMNADNAVCSQTSCPGGSCGIVTIGGSPYLEV
jgi:hypothetical protein